MADGGLPGPLPQAAVPYTTGVSVPAPNPDALPAPYVAPTVSPDLGDKVAKGITTADDAAGQKDAADKFQEWLDSGTNGLVSAGQDADATYPELGGMATQLANAHIAAMKDGADPQKTMTAYGSVLQGLVQNLQTNRTKTQDAQLVDTRTRALSADRNATQIKLEGMRTRAASALKFATGKNTDAAITAAVNQSKAYRAAMAADIQTRQAKVDTALSKDPDDEMAKTVLEGIEKDKQDLARMEENEVNLTAKRQSAPPGDTAAPTGDPLKLGL